ncbi:MULTISPECIES: PKD domain-containing protein [unclassified Methanoregula]|uniref:PKD domain-containing protein n=1 Tax=unclassified Methanoregula TaxID=2649730 RepID=UPI0025F2E174|nr:MULTISPECIES: PKD domain-containing protein [unclassified Methanoregula]
MNEARKGKGKKYRAFFRALCGALLFLLLIPSALANPFGTETLIPTNFSTYQQHAAIYGSRIVWDDPTSNAGDIFLYDIATGNVTHVTNDMNTQKNPAVFSDRILWHDLRNRASGDIYLFNLTTSLLTRITSNDADTPEYAALSGDKIVWQDRRNGDLDIYLYDLASDTEYLITPGTSGSDQVYPAVSGNWIVWEDYRNTLNGDREIYMNDTATWTESLITPDNGLGVGTDGSTDGAWQDAPSVSGNTIVWEDNRNWNTDPFPVPNIYRYDPIGGEQRISDNLVSANLPAGYGIDPVMFPSVDGDRIVWIDYRDQMQGDIYINDTARLPPEQLLLSSGTNTKKSPRISGNRIIWIEENAGSSKIHLFTYGTPETCPEILFSENATSGGDPLAVHFTDETGITRPSHWYWDFGDGSVSYQQNPDHVFISAGQYVVNLTISDEYCRNVSADHTITAGSPAADFTGSPLSGVVPLVVQFNDTSTGSPDTFAWDFENDGTVDSSERNATHTFTIPGTYNVRHDATNSYGTGTRVRTAYITALPGAHETAFTPVEGIIVDNRFGGQFLIYNSSMAGIPVLPSSGVLISHPPPSFGWQNITFAGSDAIGFSDTGNGTLFGNLSVSSLQTSDIAVRGFSPSVGDPVYVSERLTFSRYPSSGSLNAEIWEGAIASDRSLLSDIALSSSFTSVDTVGYSSRFTRTSLGNIGSSTMNMSIRSAWVAGTGGAAAGRDKTYIIAYGTDPASGTRVGSVLVTRYIVSDSDLDYFEADIPAQFSYFTNYYITQLSGSGNPLQLITLSVTSHVGPSEPYNPVSESDTGMPAAGVSPATTTAPVPTPSPTATQEPKVTADPGVSAKVYTNAQGVVSQETRLTSSDSRATITIGEGITARDAAGKPLESVTIRVLSMADLPPVPSASVFVFDGIAYEIGPDGAAFSPPVSLTLSPVQPRWGRDYSVKTFDRKIGTWQDLPTTFDGSTGIVTAPVSHFSIHALFTSASTPPPTIATTTIPPTVIPQQVKAQPPTTAVSIFMSMMGWIAGLALQNLVLIVAAAALAVAGFFVMRGRRPKWE